VGERSVARRSGAAAGSGVTRPNAAAPSPAPRGGPALLEVALGKSGLPGGTTLGRVGRRMGL